jgi:hypothetical protein
VLAEFSSKQGIPYPLLSDLSSAVIRRYGILNDQVQPGDAILHGIPYPGVFVCDRDGVVISKFFHDSYKKRDSAEILIDAALGRVLLDESAPHVSSGDGQIRITAAVHGGSGSIRQGVIRHAVLRFELDEGLHLYGRPVPEGMVPLEIRPSGPPGLVFEAPLLPPTRTLHLTDMDVDLPAWEGTFDVRIPFYAVGELASETRPLDREAAPLSLEVRYQACDEHTCLLPRTETFSLELPLDVIDVPSIGLHTGHGQREAAYDGTPHLRRLFWRKLRQHPLGFLRYLAKHRRLLRAARERAS